VSNTAIEVLQKATHEQLEPLIEYLDRPWDTRVKKKETYIQSANDLTRIPHFIDEHVRLAGGNTFVNMGRGEGPSYREVVADVCTKLGAPIRENAQASDLELSLLKTVFEKAWDKMATEERQKFLDEFAKNTPHQGSFNGAVPFAALSTQLGARMMGFATYKFALVFANAMARQLIGRGLAFAVNTALMRGISVLIGPVGWILSGAWLAIDVTGPSMSATVPCVIHIASLRLSQTTDYALGGNAT
jgi:uncharacterized protein YaaW (UPF0174 family)